mgnify:CR=1 FL=1
MGGDVPSEAAAAAGVGLAVTKIDAETLADDPAAADRLTGYDGVLVPGGFGERGVEGKVDAIRYCRERQIPFLGICLASGLALGADLTVPGALLNQLIDRSGERGRTDGAFMGWWNLATKLNLALAAGLALPLLALGGYAPGQREAGALLTLSLAYGLLPCLLKLLAMGGLYVGLMRRTDARSNAASHATTPH